MQTGTLVIIEFILVLGAVLAFGAWELRNLRKLETRARHASDRPGKATTRMSNDLYPDFLGIL